MSRATWVEIKKKSTPLNLKFNGIIVNVKLLPHMLAACSLHYALAWHQLNHVTHRRVVKKDKRDHGLRRDFAQGDKMRNVSTGDIRSW